MDGGGKRSNCNRAVNNMTITINLVAADGATGAITVADPTVNAPATTESFFAATAKPATAWTTDVPVTLGMQFTVPANTATPISATAIRWYQDVKNNAAHTALLYDVSGNVLASVNDSLAANDVWQQAALTTPIQLTPGNTYTVAVFTTSGYNADNGYFSTGYPKTQNGITVPANAGVFSYGSTPSFPSTSFQGCNYYVDIVLQPGLAGQAPPPPPTPGPLHFGMFGQSTAADYAATEQQFGMSSGSMWLSGPGLAYDSWSNYTGSAYSAAQLAMQQGRSKIFINFPPIVNGATLTQAAAGDFNTYYSQAAGQFNNSAFDTVVFRCIWEWQGGWYPWGWSSGQQNQSTYVTDFIGAFQQMVTTIRSNMGNVKNVQFCLSGAQGDQVQMPNWQACYPGDAYVDWIGVDWYDGNPGDNTGTDLASEQARWAQDNAPGAATCLQLCTQHQKGFAIPEWSVGKCGDDPYFVDQVRATLQAVQNAGLPVFAGYWRAPYGGVNGDYNLYPNTLARMLADFGGGQTS